MVWSSAIFDTGVAEQGRSCPSPDQGGRNVFQRFYLLRSTLPHGAPSRGSRWSLETACRCGDTQQASIHRPCRQLMRAAADRISMLESELHRRACQGHLGAFHDREELATADLRPQLRLQGVKRGGEPAECLKCRARKRQDRPQDPAHRRRGAGKPQLSQHFLIGHADVISNHD